MYPGIPGGRSPRWPRQASATSSRLLLISFFDRIGTFMVEWQDKTVLVGFPTFRQRKSACLGAVDWLCKCPHVMKLDTRLVNEYQAQNWMRSGFPYQISCIRWSGHGDNAQPDPEICEFVKAWNEEYEWPRFFLHFHNQRRILRHSRKQHGHQLPEFKGGDLTPYWEDGAGSSALETRMNRGAVERFVAGDNTTLCDPRAAGI